MADEKDTDMTLGAKSESTRERFHRTLVERAAAIKCVRNDIYMLSVWLLVLNFVLGGATIALLIVSMLNDGSIGTVCLICGLVLLAVTIIYNIVLRVKTPMSVLQYTAFDKGRRCCYQIVSKTRSVYADDERSVEVNNVSYEENTGLCYPQYPYDFFAEMNPDVRIATAEKETFKGRIDVDGVTKKCSITFKNGVVTHGTIGGVRIKYFDVNSTDEKFVVPVILRDAAKKCGFDLPKLPGVHIKDADGTKQ